MKPRLVHFTLASDHLEDSVVFYRDVLGARLEPVEAGGETLFRGSIGELTVVLCPAGMAGVVANRSRHQLRFEVEDVEAAAERAVAQRGRIHTPFQQQNGRLYAVVCDPDNNTIELIGPSNESKEE
jgi:predicted enzyme related to lactoylglutathione lyase